MTIPVHQPDHARNLTNQKYLDPASDEHVQNGIPQDGFTAWLRATFSM